MKGFSIAVWIFPLVVLLVGFILSRKTARKVDRMAREFNSMAAQLEAKLRELEANRSQIEGILQSMTEGVLVVTPQGDLLLANPAAVKILQIGERFEPGRPLAELVRHPDILDLVGTILKTEQPQVREIEMFAPMGQILQARGTVCRSPWAGLCALVVLHDISDLKRLEQIRKDFVANVSHELKTPLAGIRGAVETLLGGALRDEDNGRPFVEAIAEESARLQRLVEDLLVLARVESKQTMPAREPIRLIDFLKREIDRHKADAKTAQVSIRLESGSAPDTLNADPEQLSQALGNLLDNGIKYNRPGGRVVVRTSIKEGSCAMEVEDTGIGIPPADLPRLFERFYRVDKARSSETGGTGLGLSIVKHVMESHGGSVRVESEHGRGSRFTLLFPLA